MDTTRFARGLATFAGLALFGVVGWINVHHASDLDMKLVVGTLAAAAAVAAYVMKCAIKHKSYGVALFALIGVLGGEAFGFITTMERLLCARADLAQSVATQNAPYGQAKAAVEYAESAAKTECSSGRGRKCKEAEAKLDQARKTLANTPAPKASNHIATVTGIDPMIVDLAPSLAGTLALTLLGFVFLWFGHELHEVPPKAPVFQPVPVVPVDETTREGKVVNWVREYQKKHGVPPSFTAVRNEFQLPKATAHRYRMRALG
jgi:hypothetical protein